MLTAICRAALVLALLCYATTASAQVAHDGTANVEINNGASLTTHTFAAKTTTGSDRIGVMCIVLSDDSAVSAEWGVGNAMTQAVKLANPTDGRTAYLYYRIAPPTGSTDVVLTSGGGGAHSAGTVSSYTGAHQTVQTGDTSTASGTADPATVDVTSAASDMVVDCVHYLGASMTVGAAQTLVGIADDGSWYSGSSYEAGSATTTMSWTLTTPTRWTAVGWSIAQVAAAAAARRGMLLGVLP